VTGVQTCALPICNRLVDLRRKMLEANVEIEQLLRSGRSSA